MRHKPGPLIPPLVDVVNATVIMQGEYAQQKSLLVQVLDVEQSVELVVDQ